MNVLKIPFNDFLGLRMSEKTDFNYIFKIEDKPEYLNHLGTTHASVLFALAEATSGEFLLRKFKNLNLDVIPVVRKVEVKYSKPGKGPIYSKADFDLNTSEEVIDALLKSKRAIIKVKVELFDENSEKIIISVFDWFVATMNKN